MLSIAKELKNFYFFDQLSQKELEELANISIKKSYAKDEIIFYEKDTPKSLILISKGRVKVYKSDMKLNEVILKHFTPYSFVAEMAVLNEIPYPATCACVEPSEIIFINLQKFKQKFLSDQKISFSFIKSLSNKIQNLESLINLHMLLDATSKVAKYIYDNPNVLNELKQTQIATYLQMKPETLSRVLKKLLTLRLISKDGKTFKIENKDGLKEFYD